MAEIVPPDGLRCHTSPTRRRLLLGLPALAASKALVPRAAAAAEAPAEAESRDPHDSEHIRRFYELARF